MSQRQLAAIMFTDIVGYSAMMQKDEVHGKKVRERHREVFTACTEKYQGQILQYFGDGTLSIFPSAVSAVECAVEMQRQFRDPPEVPLRIGIHTGDITYGKEEAYGHGMNVAARIEPICIPGGVFISEKVYDDIQNHPWLDATSLGQYQLKNIEQPIELYAVNNKGLAIPDFQQVVQTEEPVATVEEKIKGRRKKNVAAILAFFLGLFGVHRFYLGGKTNRSVGTAYLAVSLVGMFTGVGFMVAIPAILAFIEFILYLAMPKAEFDRKYNKGMPEVEKLDRPIPKPVTVEQDLPQTPLQRAYAKVRMRNYEGAIDDFERFLQQDPTDPVLHFNLAACYSMMENATKGFEHLAMAVDNGYEDIKRIDHHFSLAFLRSRKEWAQFKNNGYREVQLLPSPEENLLDEERPLLLEKLERIEALGEMKDKGLMSEEEFVVEKRKLLND